MKKFCRMLGIACAIAAIVTLGICSYCFYTTALFVQGAKELTATVVEIERTPAEEADGRWGFRPVVQVAVAPDRIETHRFSGLYRVDSSAVGKTITLLYNPETTPVLAPKSHLNWIGSVVYGSCTVVLAILATLFVAAPRGTISGRMSAFA